MSRIYRLIIVMVAMVAFSSCTKNHQTSDVDHAAGSVDNAADVEGRPSRAPASTRASASQIRIIKQKRARKMAIINKASREFYIPPKFLRGLSKKDQKLYYDAFVIFALDMEKVLKKTKPKTASYNLDFDNILNNMFFPKADAVICPNSAWVLDIPGSTCNESTWNFRPESATNFSAYTPPASVWNAATTRCNAGVAGRSGVSASPRNAMVCPPGGWEIVGNKAYLFCNGSSTGSTGNCLLRFGSSANKRAQLRQECNSGGIRSVDNLTCADLDAAEDKWIKMYEDMCPGSGVVARMCGNLTATVNEVKNRIVDETAPLPDGELPDNPTCNALAGEHGTSRDGMSNHWQAVLKIARRACGGGSIDALAATKYGSCSKPFPGASGDFDPNNLAATWNPDDKVYIMQFVQQFGYTPAQYSRLLCGVNNVGSFVGRLEDPDTYRIGSEKELLRQFENFAETGAPESGSIFAGVTDRWPAMRDWYLSNNDYVNRTVASNNSLTLKGIKRDLEENTTLSTRIENLAKSMLSTADGEGVRANASIDQINSYVNAYLDRIGENDATRRLKYRAGLALYFRNHVPPPNHRERFEQADEWFQSCASEVASEESLGIDEERGVRVSEFESSSNCRYKQVRNPEVFGRHYDGRTPFIVMEADGEQCFKSDPPDTILERRSGDNMIRYTSIKNPTFTDSTLSGEVIFNRTSFRTESTPNRPFVLFAHSCEGDTDVLLPDPGDADGIEAIE